MASCTELKVTRQERQALGKAARALLAEERRARKDTRRRRHTGSDVTGSGPRLSPEHPRQVNGSANPLSSAGPPAGKGKGKESGSRGAGGRFPAGGGGRGPPVAMTRSSSFSSGLSSPRRGGAMAAARLPPGSAALGAQPGPPAPLVMAAPPRRGPGGTQHCSRRLGGDTGSGFHPPCPHPGAAGERSPFLFIKPQQVYRRGLRCLSAFFPLPSLASLSPLPRSPQWRGRAEGRCRAARVSMCPACAPPLSAADSTASTAAPATAATTTAPAAAAPAACPLALPCPAAARNHPTGAGRGGAGQRAAAMAGQRAFPRPPPLPRGG